MPLMARAMLLGGRRQDFLRLRVTTTQNGNATGLLVCRFRLGATEYPNDVLGDMTANDAPAPLVASASTEFGASNAAWKAFDANASTGAYWATENVAPEHWLMLDLGSGNGFDPNGLRLKIPNVPEYGLKAFVVERGDGLSFETLHSVSGEADWSGLEERTYSW